MLINRMVSELGMYGGQVSAYGIFFDLDYYLGIIL